MRLKAQITVTAGVIPGLVIPALCRAWHYTDADYQADQERVGAAVRVLNLRSADEAELNSSRFTRMLMEALRHCAQQTDPSTNNWVKLEWMWL